MMVEFKVAEPKVKEEDCHYCLRKAVVHCVWSDYVGGKLVKCERPLCRVHEKEGLCVGHCACV